jgi:hypothetical protein
MAGPLQVNIIPVSAPVKGAAASAHGTNRTSRAIVEASDDAITSKALDDKVLFLNPSATSLPRP